MNSALSFSTLLRQVFGLPCCLFFFLIHFDSSAQEFTYCEKVARQHPQTQEVLSTGDGCSEGVCFDYWRKGLCLMLNRHELIYEDEEAGANFQGLYYINLDATKKESERLTSRLYGISEHVTSDNQRFSILFTGNMNHGWEYSSVDVLEVAPKNKPSYVIWHLVGFDDNLGCATGDSDIGCGEKKYTFSLRDSSGRHYEVSSSKSIAGMSFPPSVHKTNGQTTIIIDLGISEKSLVLRFKSKKGQPGFFLENWNEAISILNQEIVSMPSQSVQDERPDMDEFH